MSPSSELEVVRPRPPADVLPAVQKTALWPSFDDWWDLYGKKSDRKKAEAKWSKLDQATRERIMEHTGKYITVGRGVEYDFRRDPMTYLNGENWNDEGLLTPRNTSGNGTTRPQHQSPAQKLNIALDILAHQQQRGEGDGGDGDAQ